MRFLNQLEKKLGKYALNNLALMLIICYGFGYLIKAVNPAFMMYIDLNPYMILRGQIWRVITWLIVPPDSFGFFTLIMLYFYYSIGTTLERVWGAFKFNAYIFLGVLFTVLGSFVLVAYLNFMGVIPAFPVYLSNYELMSITSGLTGAFSTYYMNMSIFFAFAMTFPDVSVLLFFILPIKMKYLGIIDLVLLGYEFIFGSLPMKIVIGASLLNALLFFLWSRNWATISPRQVKRRVVYKQQVHQASTITRHKCAICGRTEKDAPDLEFRFCSKCNGNYEYCNNHLFGHTHVQ